MSLFIRLQSFNNTKLESAAEKKLFGIGRGDLSHFSWAHPTYADLLLITQMLVSHQCGTIGKVNKQSFQWYKTYCQKALLQHRNHLPNTNCLTFCVKFRKPGQSDFM